MKHGKDFTIIPNKIFELGLGPFEIAVFLALKKHGNNGGNSMFPGWERLRELTGGMSRDRLWKSLKILRELNVIQWERGSKGVANTYFILGTGCWGAQGILPVDKSEKPVENQGGGSPPHGLPSSATRTRGSPPHGHQPDELEPDESNQSGENLTFGELLARIRERAGPSPRGDPH